MKFSYTLLKKLVPAIKSKHELIERLSLHVFEAEDMPGNTIEVSVAPNRFSSAGGHWGLAQEIAAVYSVLFQPKIRVPQVKARRASVEVSLRTNHCRRLIAQPFSGSTIKPSPKWMQQILEDCGFRPINNIVDITNYVMLETGQPLHAFDAGNVVGRHLIVRPATHSESLTTLDGKTFHLNPSVLVIADTKKPLDIAGIKGGKDAEVTGQTSEIILTAANFHGATIHQTSRALGLITDASVRNAHNLTPALVQYALDRAAELIVELAGGAAGRSVDVYQEKYPKRVLGFDVDACNRLTGLRLKEREALGYLKYLGFTVLPSKKGPRVVVPELRDDIERAEDLAEEVVRLVGYDAVPAIPPHVALNVSGPEESVAMKDLVRRIATALGLTEVYTHSFLSRSQKELSSGEFFGLRHQEVANPISAEYEYLRSSLAPRLVQALEDNFRFFGDVRLFEIGHIFAPEKTMLSIALGSKKNVTFLELKGIIDALLEEVGIVDRHYPDLNFELPLVSNHEGLRIESDHQVLGYLGAVRGTRGHQVIAEIDLEKLRACVEGEKEYEPPAKYPSIMRDISLLVPRHIRVGQIMELIEASAPHYLDDADMIDFYENDRELGEGMKSLTFRLVFRADDRTLTDAEADKETQKITSALVSSLGVEIR